MTNKKIIIMAIVGILILAACIILGIVISNNNNKSAEEKLKSYTCGQDGDDITIGMCDRYEEKGYIVTYKKGYDLNAKYVAVNTLLEKVPGLPVVYVEGDAMDATLREHFKTPDKKYKVDDFLYIIDYDNIEYSKIEKAIKEIECLDQIYSYSGTKDNKKK